MSEKIPSMQSLVAQMTSFAYEQDSEFRRGRSDAMRIIRNSRRCVDILDEDIDVPVKIYDEKTIVFSAEREDYSRGSKPLEPTLFTAQLDVITQIDTLPPSLRRYFDEETIDTYNAIEPGNLNTLQSVKYTIQTLDNDVDITRNIEYELRDDEDILYVASEADETDKYELVPLMHEQHPLRVPRAITEERINDQVDQVQYSAQFDEIFYDSNAHTHFYPEFLAARDAEATLAVRSLLRALRYGSKIPSNI